MAKYQNLEKKLPLSFPLHSPPQKKKLSSFLEVKGMVLLFRHVFQEALKKKNQRVLHSLKLTYPLKKGLPKRKFIFPPLIFSGYVGFREGSQLEILGSFFRRPKHKSPVGFGSNISRNMVSSFDHLWTKQYPPLVNENIDDLEIPYPPLSWSIASIKMRLIFFCYVSLPLGCSPLITKSCLCSKMPPARNLKETKKIIFGKAKSENHIYQIPLFELKILSQAQIPPQKKQPLMKHGPTSPTPPPSLPPKKKTKTTYNFHISPSFVEPWNYPWHPPNFGPPVITSRFGRNVARWWKKPRFTPVLG